MILILDFSKQLNSKGSKGSNNMKLRSFLVGEVFCQQWFRFTYSILTVIKITIYYPFIFDCVEMVYQLEYLFAYQLIIAIHNHHDFSRFAFF